MGQGTDGQICFGVKFPEGFEFPWDDEEKYEGDLEEWWRVKVCGYKQPIPDSELYTEVGEFLPNHNEEEHKKKREVNWEAKRKFDEEHSVPVELVNYCSGDCAMYILAVKGSEMCANRGYPQVFDPDTMVASAEGSIALGKFIFDHLRPALDEWNENHEEEDEDRIKLDASWWLSSYWG